MLKINKQIFNRREFTLISPKNLRRELISPGAHIARDHVTGKRISKV